MEKIDLHLGGPAFVDQGIQFQLLGLAEVIHFLEQWIELVDCVDAERLPGGLRTARTPHRGFQCVVRIQVPLDQKELHFRRNHRFPALCLVQVQHSLQDVPRGGLHRRAVVMETVVDALSGRVTGPGDHAHRRAVRSAYHVVLDVVADLGVISRDGLLEKGLRQSHAVFFAELGRRDDFAAGRAGHIRNEAFHLRDPAFGKPLLDLFNHDAFPLRNTGPRRRTGGIMRWSLRFP